MKPGRVGATCAFGGALVLAACGSDVISLGQGKDLDAALGQDDFSEPQPLAGIATEDSRDDDPTLSADRMLLFFNSRRDGGSGKEDIWFSTRESTTGSWSEPQPAQDLNTEQRETGLSLAADGLSLWFSSDRAGGAGGLDVYLATRRSRSANWSEPERIAELSTEDDDLVSSVSDDGHTAYLARRADDNDYDLFVAERDSTSAPWSAAQPLDSLNSAAEESDAFSFGAGRALVLTRDEDLWLAQRSSREADWKLAEALTSLNSDSDDRDAWLSEDGRFVVFSSDRDGDYRLFEAQRRQ